MLGLCSIGNENSTGEFEYLSRDAYLVTGEFEYLSRDAYLVFVASGTESEYCNLLQYLAWFRLHSLSRHLDLST